MHEKEKVSFLTDFSGKETGFLYYLFQVEMDDEANLLLQDE